MTVEVNIDGLVGPTHNYAGLSLGNRASMGNAGSVSSPRAAALQGLAKMRTLHRLGLVQAVMPPQQRPDPDILRRLGFPANASIADVAQERPELVPLLLSASSMWAANAATVTPSTDAADGRVHFTPANLSSTTHRSFEHAQTQRTLAAMFGDEHAFAIYRLVVQATDAITGHDFEAQHSYTVDDIVFDHTFAPATRRAESGRTRVEWKRFHAL